MTALKKYQRLESQGLWRDAPDAQRREVVVSFGDSSLILSDPKNDIALSHWSLPAVMRVNSGQFPAVYAPGPDAPESLELDDPDMILALETVSGALASARARPGRLRLMILLGSFLIVFGVLAWVGPGRLVDQTAQMVPAAARLQMGQAALSDLVRISGQPCNGPGGQDALNRLAVRLFGTSIPWQLRIMPDAIPGAVHLPGNMILLDRALVESQPGPEALAGFAVAESLRVALADPLEPLLYHAGLSATVGLMTTGALDPTAIAGYGEELLRKPPLALEEATLLAAFESAKVPTTPYAYQLDPTGEKTLALIEADPFRGQTPDPLLSAADWAGLQAICQS
jgi:hypothetical protein